MTQTHGYAIGIDTGGTYTDAILLDRASGDVVASAKTPTTHKNLSIGLSSALSRVMRKSATPPQLVDVVAVSTTLATNAVVEDKGARVGLFVIGMTKAFDLPVVSVQYAAGGHSIVGKEEAPLDVEAIVDGVGNLRGHVDAYAVSAAMSYANPTHEQVAAKAIELVDPKPVFCSHEVSGKAGMKERAATTVLNARLMPVMQEFIDGVSAALAEHGLTCPVRIVRGNGAPMTLDSALRRAAETFASGPAATAHYGMAFAPGDDALIVDVGGTTTDVTLIRAGQPTIKKGGSRIGQWETHVEAVEMFTVGIGGDSQARTTAAGSIAVGPARVLPVCMATNVPAPESWLDSGDASRLITMDQAPEPDVIAADPILTILSGAGPMSAASLMRATGLSEIALSAHLQRLVRAQQVAEIGFTPTDALHVLGRLSIGDTAQAKAAAEVLARRHGMDAEAFCEAVITTAQRKIENALLDHVVRKEVGGSMAEFIARKDSMSLVRFSAALNVPIVGIGAAARMLLPEVAQRLGAPIHFPDHFEVGNALGAALIGTKADQ